MTVTEVSPARVDVEPPRLTEVDPIVNELFNSAPFGMLEKFVPVRVGEVE